ncbi:MAG: TetR/AcrR family transcriptional regulator [Alphaproteobacteria bacterium]
MPKSNPGKHGLVARPGHENQRSGPKRTHVLQLATETMLQHGYQSTSMDELARRTGVSKATLYSYFPSKETLFRAVIGELAQSLLRKLENFRVSDLPPDKALYRMGELYLDLALLPSSINLHRLIVAEADHYPALGNLIYRNGPKQAVEALAQYLRQSPALEIENPELAAELFLGMVLGHSHFRSLLKTDSSKDRLARRRRTLRSAVAIFLHGTLAKRGGS